MTNRERMTIKEAINQAKIEMLTELQTEIEEKPMYYDPIDISDLIQQKIDDLKGEENGIHEN